MKKIRTRIAPSPTGQLHIGTVRTALYNYLFAQKHQGDFVLRIEDTDKERSTAAFEENIIRGLQNLGLAGNEGVHAGGPYAPYRQSERTEIYQKYLQHLLEAEKAYFCACSKERLEEMRAAQTVAKQPTRYDGRCRDKNESSGVVRLKVPENRGDIKWNDLIRGETVIHSKELDDFVIARSIGEPLFHFTVVADDHDMQISHVIRGEDHLSNTPKHILLFEAFNWELPQFAHLPLILNADKTKLSKRKNKVSVDDYLSEGYLPEALINFLALLGWNTPDEQELFSLEELVEKFSLDRVHKGGAVFDLKKLDWINGEYLKKAIQQDPNAFYERLLPFWEELELATDQPKLVQTLLKDPDFEGRFQTLKQIPEELSCFFKPLPDYEWSLLVQEKLQLTPSLVKDILQGAQAALEKIEWEKGDVSKKEEIKQVLIDLIAAMGLKTSQVLWPVRLALAGQEKSANFTTLMVYLGKEETLKRLARGVEKVKEID